MMSLSGQTVVLTGCTHGIGEQIAYQIAPLGLARLIIVNRNQVLADEVLAQVKALAAAELQAHSVIADLGEPSEVLGAVKAVKAILGDAGRIDILINNAGIWLADKKTYAADGTSHKSVTRNSQGDELHFATNFLSMVVLVEGLRHMMERVAAESGGEKAARVLITGSFTTWNMQKGKVGSLEEITGSGDKVRVSDAKVAPFINNVAYPRSKLLQHMWARWFAREASAANVGRDKRIQIVVWCPGAVETNVGVVQELKKMLFCDCCYRCLLRPRASAQAATIAVALCETPGTFLDLSETAFGEAGLYCDYGQSGVPNVGDPKMAGTGLTKGILQNGPHEAALPNPKGKLSRLEQYPSFKWKTAESTADWKEVEALVAMTNATLAKYTAP